MRLYSVEQAKARAKRRLPTSVFRFLEGGTEEELTVAANHAAFQEVLFRPRAAVEPESLSLETKVLGQLETDFAGVSPAAAAKVVIAYEPIWAIGTGRTASPEDAQAMCKTVRSWVAEHYGAEVAGSVKVQYGGSVTPANIAELMAQADIDGALVGGASLDAEKFAQIVRLGR